MNFERKVTETVELTAAEVVDILLAHVRKELGPKYEGKRLSFTWYNNNGLSIEILGAI